MVGGRRREARAGGAGSLLLPAGLGTGAGAGLAAGAAGAGDACCCCCAAAAGEPLLPPCWNCCRRCRMACSPSSPPALVLPSTVAGAGADGRGVAPLVVVAGAAKLAVQLLPPPSILYSMASSLTLLLSCSSGFVWCAWKRCTEGGGEAKRRPCATDLRPST